MISNKYNIYIFFFIYLVLHIYLIDNFPINFEFTFSEFSKFFKNYDYSVIDEYFLSQANTLAFPFLAGLISNIIDTENSLYITRFLSLLSYPFLFFGLLNFSKYYKFKINLFLIVLFFLNPLIWVFGYRGTPDLISVSIGFYGLSCLWKLEFKKRNFIYSILISLSIVLKPHCFIFGILLFLHYLKKKKKNFFNKFLFLLSIIPLLVILFFLINYKLFGFFLYSNNYQDALSLNFSNFFNNFLSYLGFLYLFLFPISLFFISYKKIYIKIIIYFIIYISGYLFLKLNSEMNLGSLTYLLGEKNLSGLVLCFALVGLFHLKNLILREKNKRYQLIYNPLFITIIIYILILSFFRPVQRYLIVIIPIVYLTFFINYELKFKKRLIVHILVLIFINYVLTLNSSLNAKISSKIADYLIKNNINNETQLGPINAHANFIIKNKNKEKIYYLTSEIDETSKYEQKFHVSFFNIINKNLYLVKY